VALFDLGVKLKLGGVHVAVASDAQDGMLDVWGWTMLGAQ